MAKFSVYVAGASAELERAKIAMRMLRDLGVEVTSTWVEEITKVGAANPVNASHASRVGWASTDLAQVESAKGILLLMPVIPSMGAFFEAGYAYHSKKPWWVAGENQYKSVFTALANFTMGSDEAAIKSIVRYAHQSHIV